VTAVRILVTFAVEPEFSRWRRSGFRKQTHAQLNLFRRSSGPAELSVLLTGMGEGNARRAAGAALDELSPDVCISSGFAGGLREEHRAAALLVARAVVRLEDAAAIASDEELTALARRLGAGEAVLLTAGREIGLAEDKRRLGARGDAVDMESYYVLAEARARGIPAAAVRAVCDPVESDLAPGVAEMLDEQGRVRKGALAKKLLTQPRSWPALAALGRESSRAAAALAGFLDRFAGALAEQPRRRLRAEATVA